MVETSAPALPLNESVTAAKTLLSHLEAYSNFEKIQGALSKNTT